MGRYVHGGDDRLEAIALAPLIVSVGSGVLNNLFGGGGEDAQRQARIDWFAQATRQGSPYAGSVMYGALNNVGGNERKNWQKAIDQLAADPRTAALMQQASLTPAWDSSDDRWSSRMRARAESEVAQLQQLQQRPPTTMPVATPSYVPGATTPSSSSNLPAPRPQSLPAMTTTAPYNYTPWLIGGGALLAAAMLKPSSRSRRR